MNFAIADILDKFQTVLWPLARITAVLMTVPIISVDAANARIRITLAITLTAMVYPLFPWPVIDPLSLAGLSALITEVAIGVLIGMTLQVVTAAVVLAGQAISSSMGLSLAGMIDPNLGNVPIISQFLLIMGTLVFFDLGGHLLIVSLLVDSFTLLPVGAPLMTMEAITNLLRWSSMMFVGGVLMALPAVAVLLLISIGLGILTRATPSLNIFVISVPATVAAGLLVMILATGSISGRLNWLWLQGFDNARMVLGIR